MENWTSWPRSLKRPLTLSLKKFTKDTIKAKQIIEDTLGYELNGYRAAYFSLNREYLDSLIDMVFPLTQVI